MTQPHIHFIGGGNMATALLGSLLRQGFAPDHLGVVEPLQATRDALTQRLGLQPQPAAHPGLRQADLVVWAVKPQQFFEATQDVAALTQGALHLSVAAGIRSDALARWLGTERVVRAMPNTPALIGEGMSGLFARAGVSPTDRAWVEQVLAGTGQYLWLDDEALLDAVTALSGSGPAYVFFFLEAMTEAGVAMGLSPAQAHQLSVATFVGASQLAHESAEPPAVLRQRVTSKGGTTHAALEVMEHAGLKPLFIKALQAAQARAREMGEELGEESLGLDRPVKTGSGPAPARQTGQSPASG